MAWGVWNKIKKGLGKAVSWFGHHVGDIADAASAAVDAFAPEAAGAMSGIDSVAHAVQNAVTHNGRG